MDQLKKPSTTPENTPTRNTSGKTGNSTGELKIISIGDLHGSKAWKKIKPGDWDRIIFSGDYVDSSFIDTEDILNNLESVIRLKKRYPGKVILLWGNHDLAYFYGGHERHYASGFKPGMLPMYLNLFTTNRKLFQAAFGIGNYLWTHAGVVQQWYDNNIAGEVKGINIWRNPGAGHLTGAKELFPAGSETRDTDLAATLNRLFDQYYLPLFNVGFLRGGLNKEGGIFWADKQELEADPLKGYHQIVGHNKTRSGIRISNHFGIDTSITWLDCLETQVEFFQLRFQPQ